MWLERLERLSLAFVGFREYCHLSGCAFLGVVDELELELRMGMAMAMTMGMDGDRVLTPEGRECDSITHHDVYHIIYIMVWNSAV